MQIYTGYLKAIFTFILFFFLIIVVAPISLAQENETANETLIIYQKNRQAFLNKKKEIDLRFRNKETELVREIKDLEKNISGRNSELSRLNGTIHDNQRRIAFLETIQSSISFFLFPVAAFGTQAMSFFIGDGTGAATILSIFLSLTVLNVFLYILFRQKRFFSKYRIALIVTMVVLISAIAAPLFAEENLTKREKIIDQLEFAEKVLSLTDHERFIAILEARVSDQIDLPELATGDPLLTVFRSVKVETPKYYFTIAALYMHEGKSGNAVDAIEKIVDKGFLRSGRDQDLIAINSIKFLIKQKQTELAGKAVENLAGKIGNVSVLLQLADYLHSNGMQVSEEKMLGYAINKAGTVKELIELSTFLLEKGENDKGTDALQRALSKVKSVNDLILVTEAAIKAQKDNIVEEITQKTRRIATFQGRIQMVDVFLASGRMEEAVSVFSEMTKEVKVRTPDKINKLLFLIDAALKRDFIPQAVKATERLFLNLGKEKSEFRIKAGSALESSKELPDPDKITLPQFYGLLNEELGYTDKAEDQYIASIDSSLKHILQSYGYKLPDTLNSFYLLGRVWVKENRGDMIGQLDRVYTIIEEQFIRQHALKNDRSLERSRDQLEKMKTKQEQLLSEIKSNQNRARSVSRELTLRTISIFATIAFIVLIMVGCIIIAYQYAKKLAMHKTFGFITKFIEATGWVRVFSILGILSGLGSILVAQFFHIQQGVHENTFFMHQDKLKAISSDQEALQVSSKESEENDE